MFGQRAATGGSEGRGGGQVSEGVEGMRGGGNEGRRAGKDVRERTEGKGREGTEMGTISLPPPRARTRACVS